MLKSFSNKAIATKARAMYGARVTAADCEELVKSARWGRWRPTCGITPITGKC